MGHNLWQNDAARKNSLPFVRGSLKNFTLEKLTWDLPERPTTDLDFQIFAKSSIIASKWLISPANRKIFISATEFWLSLKNRNWFFYRVPFKIQYFRVFEFEYPKRGCMDFILWGRSNIHMTSHPLRDVTSSKITW